MNVGSWSRIRGFSIRNPVPRAEGHLEADPRRVRRRVRGAGEHGADLIGEVVDVYLHLVQARCHGEVQQQVDPDQVRRRVRGAGEHGADLIGEVVDVYLHLVQARCHGEVQQQVDPDHAAPPRGEGKRV